MVALTTRGYQAQMQAARPQSRVARRISRHQRQHEREQADRAVNRRWGIGLAVAVLGAVGGLYPYLHVLAHH